ncbi:hypothetical protein [Kitasatospora sp. CB01950]|uniref:hypothetical protein n=1 Tax=Kitasatospora sp. CB01950 TaxID=1703930 RepID=UPI00093C0424|nr:hypothetical protein [Kitasatospora sp. CB01950]OKJ11746.1 hypothetical protein AMK19_12865 [Kitasatospora sp. CB01950]
MSPDGVAPSAHLSPTIREAAGANLYTVVQSMLAEGLPLPGRPPDDAALTGAAAAPIEHATTLPAVTRQLMVRPAA